MASFRLRARRSKVKKWVCVVLGFVLILLLCGAEVGPHLESLVKADLPPPRTSTDLKETVDDLTDGGPMSGGFPHIMLFGMTGLAGRESGMIGYRLFILAKYKTKKSGQQNTDNTGRNESCFPFVAFIHLWTSPSLQFPFRLSQIRALFIYRVQGFKGTDNVTTIY